MQFRAQNADLVEAVWAELRGKFFNLITCCMIRYSFLYANGQFTKWEKKNQTITKFWSLILNLTEHHWYKHVWSKAIISLNLIHQWKWVCQACVAAVLPSFSMGTVHNKGTVRNRRGNYLVRIFHHWKNTNSSFTPQAVRLLNSFATLHHE